MLWGEGGARVHNGAAPFHGRRLRALKQQATLGRMRRP